LRYFLEIQYKGSHYHGWQSQPEAITVQEVLEHALSRLLSQDIVITGAGRTDAGVHALQMYAHFDVDKPLEVSQLTYRLNAFLPKDIAIKALLPVIPSAHARFDAEARSYVYKIHCEKNAFLSKRSYYLKQTLDVVLMNEACSILFQYSDFECFSKSNTDVNTYNCTIHEAKWLQRGSHLEFHITADRFLRNMVRAIVGTMLNIGTGKSSIEDLHQIIRSKDRSKAGYSVPAHGLYLSKVTYPDNIWIDKPIGQRLDISKQSHKHN
jgi:tRNA pseudouridine38-40 synthase